MKSNGKISRAFKKVLVGTKKGYSGARTFVKTYGPPAQKAISRMAHGIQEGFEVRRPRPKAYVDYTTGNKPFRPKKSNVNWEKLGMRF